MTMTPQARRAGAKADGAPFVLGLGGSLRQPSQSEAALRLALRGAEEAGAVTALITGADLDLPLYSSAHAGHPAVLHLLASARRADGLILASPAYHGSISGAVKNALDYLQFLSDDDPPYLDGRAVGAVSTGLGTQAAVQTVDALRNVAHALRAWPTPIGVAIHEITRVYQEGEITDARTEELLRTMGAQVVEFARSRRLLHELEAPRREVDVETLAHGPG